MEDGRVENAKQKWEAGRSLSSGGTFPMKNVDIRQKMGTRQQQKGRFQNFYGKELMENSEKNNEQIGLQQKNTLLQAWSDFKDSIFNVLFVILDKKSEDEEEESLGGLIFESGFDYLQIMAFPFNSLVIGAWNGGNSLDSMSNFFQKFNVSSYLPSAPYAAFLFMLYFLIFIILLIVIDIIYVSYSFSKKKFKFTFPLIILAQVVPLFVTILFLPITEILLNVVQCQKNNDVWHMVNFPEVVCWEGWHLFHTTITLLFVTLFVIISTIVALALFEPRMTTKKLTARQNSNGEVVFIINKIVLQFFFSFSPFSGSAFYVVIIFILSFWQFWYYAIKKPYYSKVATKFFKICSTYYFWTALMLMAGQMLQGYGFNGSLLVWISGLPFFAIIIFYDGTIKGETLHSNNLKFKTGEELQSHIALVLELICNQKEDKNSSMLLIGYIQRHKEICNESDCPLTSDKKKRKGDSTMEYNCAQLLKQIQRMFKTGIKKFPECTKLRLSFAFFHLEHMHNKKRAYEEFTESFNLDPSFEQQFNIYRFKKIIKENLEDRQENESDLVQTIRLDNHVSLLEEAMILSAKLHKDFWAELKQEKPDLKKLNIIGSQITEAGNAITENYTEISKITSSNSEVLYSYAHYLMLVNGDFTEGRELLSNARKIFQDKQVENKNEQEVRFETESLTKMTSPMIVVSYPSALSAPRITNSNLLFTEISGYQRAELFDRELSLIAPNIFINSETQCLSFSDDDKDRESFIKHKFSHLIGVTYEVSKKDQGEWHVVFKLAPSSNIKMVLLADPKGKLTDYNLLATNSIQPASSLSLSDLGIQNWHDSLLRKQNGSPMRLNLNSQPCDCLVQMQPIIGMVMVEAEAEDEESAMMVVQQKEIGFKVTLIRSEKNGIEDDSEEEASLAAAAGAEFDEGVLELYENPNAIDIFISQLAETKQFEDPRARFELKDKIKTMRLLNNEIKMVYSQGNDNECSEAADRTNEEDDREVFKFDDETYQAKLRTAINTDLNHQEVITLRRASCLFVTVLIGLCFFQMVMEGMSVSSVDNYVTQINNRAEEYSWLTSNLMASIDGTSNYTQIYASNQGHNVDFESSVDVTLTMENNLTVTKNLKDAVIFLNSRLMSYFLDPTNNQENLLTIFYNYYSNIYPAFINHPSGLSLQTSFSYYMGAAALGITIFMMLFWIYISLTIDKKRYDIMIWFLDIPIPYVSHLGTHCDLYLKQFLSIKELSQKGIPLDEEEDNYEEFSNKKNNPNEEEIEEQIKTRKSLISKNKKETLISKINLSALKVTWLLIYGLFFSSLLLVLTQTFYQHFAFLEEQWVESGNMVTVDSTLYFSIATLNSNITLPLSLPPLLTELRMRHKDVISEWQTRQFNEQISLFPLTSIADSYSQVYFGNLCEELALSSTDLAECQTLVGNKLASGYEVYSKYLITPELVMGSDIEKANRKYVVPAMSGMMGTWDKSLTGEGESLVSLCTIMLYVFIILSVVCYLLLWLYYLRKLNTELNQTIQMLNMIPFKLLPKSRKETKMFIAWIIREANKTKHENE